MRVSKLLSVVLIVTASGVALGKDGPSPHSERERSPPPAAPKRKPAAKKEQVGLPNLSHRAVKFCGHDPESWVRGFAELNRNTGRIKISLELETDSLAAGPKGWTKVEILDAADRVLYSLRTHEHGIPGKMPGGARREQFTYEGKVPVEIAKCAAKLVVTPHHTGVQHGIFGTPLSVVRGDVSFPMPK